MSKLLEDPKVAALAALAALVTKSETAATKAATKAHLEVVKSAIEANKETEDKAVTGFSFWILLANRGNPDHAQNPKARVFGTPRDTWAGASSLGHASALAQAYRNENSLGSGNWTGGQVLNRDGQQVARVAFNGRVFAHPDESLLIEASHPADYGLEC